MTCPAEGLTFCSDEIYLPNHESEIGMNTGKRFLVLGENKSEFRKSGTG